MPRFALGLDFGTSSVRALLVDCADGSEAGSGVAEYASGLITDPSDPNLARQHPGDYANAMQHAIRAAIADTNPSEIVGIGVDGTGSTPIPVFEDGTPLALAEPFDEDLNAQAWLWKDHTSHGEAAEITSKAKEMERPFLSKCGGAYSSEWFWAKALHCSRIAPNIFGSAYTWIELCDYIPGLLTNQRNHVPRSVCAAGHKAMYSEQWGGLPDREFLAAVDPALASLRNCLYERAYPSDHLAGGLSKGWAEQSGLKEGTPVAVGLLDAHAGAVGSGVAQGRMVKILGTSTCDILVAPPHDGVPDIPGVSGIVDGSVVPGMIGIEAGQSAVGDIFDWWSRVSGPSQEELSQGASALKAGQSGLLALDWNNGNRNVLADPRLTGLLVGQTLHTSAAEVYRALIEATAFGALKIIRRLQEHQVPIEELVACGGIAERSPLVLQIYADVLNRPIRLSGCGQACALGAAVFGAVVGVAHPDVPSAQRAMTSFDEREYRPDVKAAGVYARLFGLYDRMHDAFGISQSCELGSVMKELLEIRQWVSQH